MIILAYIVLIIQTANNSGLCQFSNLIMVQFSAMIFLQVLLNFLGSIDVLPFTGVCAPLISSGGSSEITFGALAGIVAAMKCPELTVHGETQRKEGNYDRIREEKKKDFCNFGSCTGAVYSNCDYALFNIQEIHYGFRSQEIC